MIFLIIFASITQLLVSLFVLFRKKNNLSNILFFFIGITSLCWAFANYISVSMLDSESLVYIVRSILFFVVLQNYAYYLFARTFPKSSWEHSKRWLLGYSLFSAFVALVTMSPYVFASVTAKDNLPITVAGPGLLVFILHAAYSTSGVFKELKSKMHSAAGVERRQFQWLLFSAVLILVVVPVTNFAITPLLKTTLFVVLSPVYTLAFASIIAYAIVSQKLFDIRAAVARSVAYVLSLGFIGLVYGSIIFTIFSVVDFGNISEFTERAIFVGMTLVTATAYPITKKYFDKLTTRLFYQDAYDSQEFLERINKLLVGQTELEQLLVGITDAIEGSLKSSYCVFIVRETAYEDVRIVGSEHHKFNKDKIVELRELTPHTHKKVLIADEIDADNKNLKPVLDSLDVSILIRLVSDEKQDLEGMGYLVLGPKKNGAIFSTQDKQVLEILANEMIIAVENALRFEEIEKFNLTLQNKVDSATAELQRTNEKLKEMDETKDEFISMASHQLRTPLTSVKGYLSMVLEGDVGKVNKQQDRMLEQAFLSSQRMVYLIADLLNVSRLKTGKFVIDTKDTDLAKVVETEVEQLRPTAKSRDLTINYKAPKNFPMLAMDETKIRQVIMNFIDNAIYYTPAGGKIDISLEDKGETIEYLVKDSGIGVPRAERHNLFSKFYRANNARKARPDGTGLGLFMAKKVVVAQGGAIIFETEEGKGSTFGFTFSKDKLAKLAAENREAT